MRSWTQEASLVNYLAECERKFGSDADLVNGEKYFYPYSQTDGDPYLGTAGQAADIHIRGKEFLSQDIKYDILNQYLILSYPDLYGATTSIILRNEWVESFSIGSRTFTRIEGPEGNKEFFQEIYRGKVSCYYKWSKEYQLNLSSGVQSYFFTDPKKESFIVVDKKFQQFRNNRSFIKVFSGDQQKAVKNHLRQTRLRVKGSSDHQMFNLVEFCSSLLNETS